MNLAKRKLRFHIHAVVGTSIPSSKDFAYNILKFHLFPLLLIAPCMTTLKFNFSSNIPNQYQPLKTCNSSPLKLKPYYNCLSLSKTRTTLLYLLSTSSSNTNHQREPTFLANHSDSAHTFHIPFYSTQWLIQNFPETPFTFIQQTVL